MPAFSSKNRGTTDRTISAEYCSVRILMTAQIIEWKFIEPMNWHRNLVKISVLFASDSWKFIIAEK